MAESTCGRCSILKCIANRSFPIRKTVDESEHSWETRDVSLTICSWASSPCRVPSTIPLTLAHPQTQAVVRSTTKVPPNIPRPRRQLTNAPSTTNPHPHPGHASFPLQARVTITFRCTPIQMCQETSLRNEKLPRFRGWKGTNGCTLPNPSSSPLWSERTTTRRRKT